MLCGQIAPSLSGLSVVLHRSHSCTASNSFSECYCTTLIWSNGCLLHSTDLKTPNVLLQSNDPECMHVKVIDFGGARKTE